MIQRTRRRRPRILTLVAVLIAAAIWVKLGTLVVFSGMSGIAWGDENYRDSAKYTSLLLTGNVIEEHKAHYNFGTAEAAQGSYGDARQSLRTALRLSPEADECIIRLNLGLVLEQLAAEAGESEAPPEDQRFVTEAAIVVEDAAPECQQGKLAQLNGRLMAALADEVADGDDAKENTDADSGDTGPAEDSDAAAELREQMTQGKAEQSEETSDGKRKNRDPVARPW